MRPQCVRTFPRDLPHVAFALWSALDSVNELREIERLLNFPNPVMLVWWNSSAGSPTAIQPIGTVV
jgi:hypothetical protein